MRKSSAEFGLGALMQVVEQNPVSILITDILGEIVYVNPALTQITGYTKKELIGKNPRVFKSGAHNKAFYKELWGTLSSGNTWNGELLNRKKDGVLYWERATISPVLNAQGDVVYYVGTKEDISHTKYSNEELMRSESLFHNLAETAPVTIAKIDKQGILLYFNNYFPGAELETFTNISEILLPKNESELKQRISGVFQKRQVANFELECTNPLTNTESVYLIRISPNFVGADIDGAILIAQDITELIVARKSAKEWEKHLRLLAENVSDVIWMMDNDGSISYVTPSITDLSGYSGEEFMNYSLGTYLTKESVSLLHGKVKKLQTQNNPELVEVWESVFKKKDGGRIWVETHMRLAIEQDAKVSGIIGVMRDVTERRQSQQAILHSEAKFRSFFENSNAIILVIDPEQGRIIDANIAACNYYGYSRDEFKKLDPSSGFAGLIEMANEVVTDPVGEHKRFYAQKHRLKRNNYRNVEVRPAKVMFENKALVYVIIQDTTQRKKAIEALKESESKKLALLKIIPDLIFVINHEGEFLDIYTDSPKRLVVPPYKLLGKKCFFLFPESMAEKIQQSIDQAIKTRDLQRFEYNYERGSGELVYEEVRVLVSGVNEVLAIVRDVTQQKINELELQKAWEDAKEADKIKSAFLANISHEIRTPINAIQGFSDILKGELESPEHQQYIQSISTSSRTLLRLINDLLDLSKIEAGMMRIHSEPIQIRSIINDVESIFLIKLKEKGLGFNVTIGDDCPEKIVFDGMRLKQILINLIGNAIKFTHQGAIGVIVDLINSYGYEGVNYVDLRFQVTDTGIGISDNVLPNIFDPFKQQDEKDARKYGGTGLGLTITKKITELLNGIITVETEPGRGSCFTLDFINVELFEKIKRAESESGDVLGNKIPKKSNILLIDDKVESRRLIKSYLEGSEIVFHEYGLSQSSTEIVNKVRPNLVLMDLNLPDNEGVELAKAIRLKNSDLPIVAYSSLPVNFDSELSSLYINEFISKPINIVEFVKKISAFLPVKKQERTERQLTEGGVETLQENQLFKLKKELKEVLQPSFEQTMNTSSFSDYENFASLLREISMKLGVKKLTYLGNGILDALKTFDLEEINRLVSEYRAFIGEIIQDDNE